MSRKQDQRVWVLLELHPDNGAVIIDGVRYGSLKEAAAKRDIEWEAFDRKVRQRKIVVVVPGK